MLVVLGIFLSLIGVFFLSLGLLFIKYELSPLKYILDKSSIDKNVKLGIQIIAPSLVLFWLTFKVLSSR